METTDALYRFKGVVPAGKSTNLAVKEQMVQDETLEILPGDTSQIDVYSRTGEIPKAVRDALAKAVQLKNAVVDTQRQIQDRDQALTDITTEQSRIRDDMKAADDRQAPYYVRLLKKLDDQESTIEKLQAEKKGLEQAVNDQQKALEDYLANLNVG
jgi:chromosome segregation ATPase